MLDDFHESTRSVGLVGILLALLVLAGFCGLGMAAFSATARKNEPSITMKLGDQETRVTQAKRDLKKQTRRMEELLGFQKKATEVSEKKAALETVTSALAATEESLIALQDEIEAGQLNFEEYRDQYRASERAKAIGEVLDLSETKGPSFAECKVRSITPLHLSVMRSSGPIGIHYTELPEAIQDRFQLGGEEAIAYQRELDARSDRQDKRIAAWQKKQNALKGEAAIEAKRQRIVAIGREVKGHEAEAARMDASSKEWLGKAAELDRKAAAARQAGRISSNPGHARQARNKAAFFERQANHARLQIRNLLKEQGSLESQLLNEKE